MVKNNRQGIALVYNRNCMYTCTFYVIFELMLGGSILII